jgi:hypothetical protein
MKMKSSRVFLISVFITTVILVAVGGVSTMVMANKNASPAADKAIQAYQQREAEYNQLIDQANQQLAKANSELAALQSGAVAQADSQAAVQPAVDNNLITAAKALETAQKVVDVGSEVTKKPELVDYQGKTVYEVAFDKGSVFVDAQTAEVLFNGTVPQEITAKMAAQIASDYLNLKGILQVDQITFRGQQLFRVIFKNGTFAYLDKTGQITYVQLYNPNNTLNASVDNGGGGGSGAPQEHEEEHESD